MSLAAAPHTGLVDNATRNRAMSLGIAQAVLGTLGAWLVGGMTFNYFAMELGAKGRMLGIILAVGNIASILRLIVPYFVNRSDNRKRVWLYSALAGRVFSLGFPLLAFPAFRPAGIDPLILLVLLHSGITIVGAIGDVAWLSWFADIVPETIWGRYFSRRNMWAVPAAITMQLVGGRVVDSYTQHHPASRLTAYAIVYAVGICFQLASMLPIALVPNLKLRERPKENCLLREIAAPFRDPNFRRYAFFWCWLMLGNGIPQASFQLYTKNYLALGLLAANLFQVVNQCFNFVGQRFAGPMTDRFGNKPLIILGLAGAALGPFFWLPTSPGHYTIMYAAYVVWGLGWACVNLGCQNLMLKIAPRGNNVGYIAAVQAVGGASVALCMILGGNWLEVLLNQHWTFRLGPLAMNAYHLFFFLSFLGRSSAALWVFRIREPRARTIRRMVQVLSRASARRRRLVAASLILRVRLILRRVPSPL